MSVASYLADSPSVCQLGEFSYRDIVNGQYVFEVDIPDVYQVGVIGKGPYQDSRTSKDNDIDVIVIGQDSAVSSGGFSSIACQSSLTKSDGTTRAVQILYPSVTKIPKGNGKTVITIPFSYTISGHKNELDTDGYTFRYFVLGQIGHHYENYSKVKLNYVPGNDASSDFKYSIVNKLNYPQGRPNEVRQFRSWQYYRKNLNYTYARFDGETAGDFLTTYDYFEQGKSILFSYLHSDTSNHFGSGFVVSWPDWLEPSVKQYGTYTSTYSAYWLGSETGEKVTISDTRNSNGRIDIQVVNAHSGRNEDGSQIEGWITISNPEVD